MTDAVCVTGRLTPETVTGVASKLRALPRSAVAMLDLSPLDGVVDETRHLDLRGVALLANILLTTERRRPLMVRIPTREAVLRQLARGGLWFALAQRGSTEIEAGSAADTMFDMPPSIAHLDAWRSRWDPSDHTFKSSVWGMVADSDRSVFNLVQREFVAFVNPHLSVNRDRLVKDLNENVARRWIERLNAQPGLTAAATEAITELLYNLAAHPFSAISSRPITKRDVPTDRRFGLLNLFTTSGGGGDRLHIMVSDTGHGIPATLRPKFARRDRDSLGTDAALITAMLGGKLPPYGRGEGRGFPRLVELAKRFRGGLQLATSGDDEIGVTLVGQVSDTGKPSVEVLPTMDIAGTIVQVSLGLERVRHDAEPPSSENVLALG